MNKLIIAVLLTVFSSLCAFAKDSKPNQSLMNNYIKIQEALANDYLDSVPQTASEIAKKSADEKIIGSAQVLASAKDIKLARLHFKDLSKEVIRLESPKGGGESEFIEVNCPMAKASWLQKKGDVKNPYYGKEMLSCGVVKK